jgi:signal transduction histidine kinase
MKSTLQILCLEDDEEDFMIIKYILEESGLAAVTKRVDTREKYLDAIVAYQPDIILSDHSLPKFNSTEALQLLQTMNLQIPFILVTGAVSDEFAVSCIKLGAHDYVLKSNLSRLPTAITNALKHKENEQAKLSAMSELAYQNNSLLKINKELDTFVYSVSHNLRAPLMSVLGLLNLAKHETQPETLQQYHTLMESSIHKLDDTLKEILDYSRNAREELKVELIDFENLVKENLEKMQFMPGYQQLKIVVSVNDAAPFYSDHYRLSVIVNNLISNAIKYHDSTKATPAFTIRINCNRQKAIVEFEDNGMGIQKELMPKIFNMFFRATNKQEGSGLGLYIVKEAVDKLRGKIQVESEIGRGTTFKVELPNHLDEQFANAADTERSLKNLAPEDSKLTPHH